MGSARWGSARGTGWGIAGGVAAVVVVALIGVASVDHSVIALAAAGVVLAVGVLFLDPVLLVVLALPASLLMNRVGGILSVADLILALSTAVALVWYRAKGMRHLAPLLWGGVIYLATAAPTLILNPYRDNVIEFAHEGVLVLGSLTVGFVIGQKGRARQATILFILANVVLAVVTVFTGLTMLASQGSFGAVYLPEFHKNLIGSLLGTALVIVYARPAWFRLSPLPFWSLSVLFAAGMFASQSRQALIGAVVALMVVSIRRRPETGKRPTLIWFASIPVIVFVMTMVTDQLASDNKFNSSYQRLDWYGDTFRIWAHSPVFGVGLRWWYTGRFPDGGFQPPNAELEVLSSVGIVGLIGFLVMFAVAAWTLWRVNPAYGTVALAVIIMRLAAGQFDLYWVAGQASILWIVAGMAVGALVHDRERGREAPAAFPEPARTPMHVSTRPRRRIPGGVSSTSHS